MTGMKETRPHPICPAELVQQGVWVMSLPERETCHEMESPRFPPKAPLVSVVPASGLSLMQTPVPRLPSLQNQLTSKFPSYPEAQPLRSPLLHRPPPPSEESDFPASLARLLVLGGDAGLPQATVSRQEAETSPSSLLKDVCIVGIFCWQLFSSGPWIHYSLSSGLRDFCREVGSKSAMSLTPALRR